MTMASVAYIDFTWQPGADSISQASGLGRPESRGGVYIENDPIPQLAAGSRSMASFLDAFEADPDVAPGMADARRELAQEIADHNQSATLRELRLARGLSQRQFADLLETSQPRVSRLEARVEKAAEDTLRSMARVLEVDFNTLMKALASGD